jgi:o-succinylbenzoate---CoA ligase
VALPENLEAGPGDLVAVRLPPGAAWLAFVRSLWEAGAALLPLDHRLSRAELRAIVHRAEPSAIVDEGGATVRTESRQVDPEVGLVMATSGSAGTPKLAELGRGALAAALRASNERTVVAPEERWTLCLSPAHIGGMLVLLRAAVFGTPVTVLDRFDPQRLLAEAPEGSHVSLVPTMLHRLVSAGEDLGRLGVVLVGGGGLDRRLARAAGALHARVVSTYGLTETCGGLAYDGILFDGTGIRFGPDEEIQLAGPTLMRGYVRDPQATATAFTLDGWLRTGDAGELADDGRLRVHGRLDDVIRTGAEKVWPQEVEAAIREHPRVAEVAVAGRADPEWGQQVVAYVVPASIENPPTLQELRDFAADRVARFKAPRDLVLVPELPRTTSGKLRRTALPRT